MALQYVTHISIVLATMINISLIPNGSTELTLLLMRAFDVIIPVKGHFKVV